MESSWGSLELVEPLGAKQASALICTGGAKCYRHEQSECYPWHERSEVPSYDTRTVNDPI